MPNYPTRKNDNNFTIYFPSIIIAIFTLVYLFKSFIPIPQLDQVYQFSISTIFALTFYLQGILCSINKTNPIKSMFMSLIVSTAMLAITISYQAFSFVIYYLLMFFIGIILTKILFFFKSQLREHRFIYIFTHSSFYIFMVVMRNYVADYHWYIILGLLIILIVVYMVLHNVNHKSRLKNNYKSSSQVKSRVQSNYQVNTIDPDMFDRKLTQESKIDFQSEFKDLVSRRNR